MYSSPDTGPVRTFFLVGIASGLIVDLLARLPIFLVGDDGEYHSKLLIQRS